MTKLRGIKKLNVRGKRVLVRTNLNVPMVKGKITSDFRIKKSLETINFLKKEGAKVILLSHLTSKEPKTLKPVAKYLSKSLAFDFISEIFGKKVEEKISNMKNGDILLLENLRCHEGEEKNSSAFAKKLASLGDIFVNDDFGVSHRKHASIVSITKYLPSYAGLLFEEEFDHLHSVFKPKHPFLIILGGVKFKSKLSVLKRFIKVADQIFVGGALAHNFFREQGVDIGKSKFDDSVDIKKYINNPKIILPVDVKKKNGMILDFGPRTIELLNNLVKKAKFIVWNGPVSNTEKKGFEKGTVDLAKLVAKSKAKTIIGGGDTIAAISTLGVLDKFSFVSTAGGAMLHFLSEGTLPGIEALRKSK